MNLGKLWYILTSLSRENMHTIVIRDMHYKSPHGLIQFICVLFFYLDIVFIVLVSNAYSHGNAVPCARVGLAGQL